MSICLAVSFADGVSALLENDDDVRNINTASKIIVSLLKCFFINPVSSFRFNKIIIAEGKKCKNRLWKHFAESGKIYD